MDLRLRPLTVVRFLAWILFLLFLLHLSSWIPVFASWQDHPVKQINLAGEQNLSTLFSCLLLGLCGMLTWLIAHAEGYLSRNGTGWLLLTLAFLALSVDELIMIHEKVGNVLHAAFNTTGIFQYAWVLPYMVLMFIFVAVQFRFYLRMPSDTRLWVSIAAVLYVSGGMGFEMIEGLRFVTAGRDAVFQILCTLEELFEMAGCILFAYAFVLHIDRHLPDFQLRITSA